ncbi:hypothetical protein LKM2_715 [Leptospira kirschneri serovar Mozdok]|nr:hypothetical protein [Leptospira kirschneri serovar Mozdok]
MLIILFLKIRFYEMNIKKYPAGFTLPGIFLESVKFKLKLYFKGLNSRVTTPRVADLTSKDLVAKKENPLSFL